jgi:sensor domain CHASE-containing protein
MPTSNRYGLKFVLLIVLPFALSAIGILWATFNMLDGISTGANTQQHLHTRQVVMSAFKSAEKRLYGIMADNAYWDDAVRNSYGSIDDQWMYDTWGVGTEDINYDAMFIVEKDGTTVTGYREGQKLEAGGDYIGAVLPVCWRTCRRIQDLRGRDHALEYTGRRRQSRRGPDPADERRHSCRSRNRAC